MKKFFSLLLAVTLGASAFQASPSPSPESSAIMAKAPAGFTELNYAPADWNEAPDLKFYGSSSNVKVQSSQIYLNANNSTDAESMIVEFTTTESSVFMCHIYSYESYTPIRMYCDGELNRTLTPYGSSSYQQTVVVDVASGEHQIKFEVDANSSTFYIEEIGILKMPLISVDLAEPGSLGTEILYNDVERLQDVRNLKVKGTLNDDDVDKLNMMKGNLVYLDLSEANLSTIRDELFKSAPFLNTVILPENLKSIGKNAFHYSSLENITFPESLESIGPYAFANTQLKEAIMPDATTSIGNNVFFYCSYLTTARLSDYLTEIPQECFRYCYLLNNFELPSNLKTIGSYAFSSCYYINMDLPESLQSIGREAFCITNSKGDIKSTLTIPEGCSVGQSAFYFTNYTYAILPTSFSSVDDRIPLPNTTERIKLKSATVVTKNSYNIVDDNIRANITLEVPSYLVNAYKLDPYWYNFKEIIGFDTNEIDYWNVKADLVLNARDRMLGTPSIDIANTGSIKINGTDAMPLNNLHIYVNNNRYNNSCKYGRIFSNADGVTIDGTLSIDMYIADEKRWFYVALPFDVKVSDIQHLDEGLFAVRYYDGANRAANGTTGSWTNFDVDAVIPAASGFIINVNKTGTLRFTAQDNDSKQYITSNLMFATPLEANASDVASDRGWNLVGNPYQCFYNIHKLNFTAPITTRNVSNNTYEAYSIIDDDYALSPNQAFFVQCPDGVAAISFPLDGRQMTSEITSQQGAPALNPLNRSRRLTDISVSFGEYTDRTRIVLNESASTDYELSCDASKFLSEDALAAQLYTIENEEYYAINERPALDGNVSLGFIAGQKGKYTISVIRNYNEHVYLTDLLTGVETELSAKDYTFESEAGTFDNRFVVSIANSTSLIQSVNSGSLGITVDDGMIVAEGNGSAEVYDLTGVKIASVKAAGSTSINVAPGTYIVKTDNGVVKVSVN